MGRIPKAIGKGDLRDSLSKAVWVTQVTRPLLQCGSHRRSPVEI